MTFGTVALRVLSFASLWASAFWVLAFAWSAYRDPPPVPLLAVLSLLVVSVTALIILWRWPAAFVVPEGTDWTVLLRRLMVAGVVAYLLLCISTYALGAGLMWALGLEVHDTEFALAVLAWWAPIWLSPLGTAALAWRWCRSDGPS